MLNGRKPQLAQGEMGTLGHSGAEPRRRANTKWINP
jgi:hypothetical protein